MVTPFTKDKEIDEEGYRSNINYLIEKGVSGLVAAGTTGESATMSHEEHRKVVEILIDEVDGRVQTIAGSGSNSTNEAIQLTTFAEDAGADATLVITPYYNKPQQHALVKHYGTLADACDIPIIAYCVPSRTGSELCRQMATLGASTIVLFDNAETPLHDIRIELDEKWGKNAPDGERVA